MEKADIYNWLSVLYLVFMVKIFSYEYVDILWIWIVLILVAGNVKRVYIKKYESVLCYIRRLLYVCPYLFVILYIRRSCFQIENIWWIIIGGGLGIIMQIPKLRDWMIMWDYEILKWKKKPHYEYLSAIIMLFCVPVGEELFYRAFILEKTNNVILGIITSSILFVLNHFGTKWNSKFSMYDLIVQIIFSVVSCYLVVASKSVLPSIVAHLFYNMPPLISNVRGYILCKRTD